MTPGGICVTPPPSMAPASGVHFKVTQERLGHSSMSGGARRDSNPIRFLGGIHLTGLV